MLERIQTLCKQRGIKIRHLEQDLGFGRGTIEKWNDCIPRADRIKAVADYFGVTVDELLK